jgi:hypothetical protein
LGENSNSVRLAKVLYPCNSSDFRRDGIKLNPFIRGKPA